MTNCSESLSAVLAHRAGMLMANDRDSPGPAVACCGVRGAVWSDLFFDVRYALRVLWQAPAFALVAVFTLMLGIGTNIVVFGLVNAVLLRPIEVSEPQNLYQLRLRPWTSFKLLTTSYPAYEDYRQRNSTLSELGGFYGYAGAILHWGNSSKNIAGYAVTGNYFDLLGVQPQVGRFFHTTDEHGPNSAPYLVVSDHLWRSAFNADPGIVGKTVQLYKNPFTVIGVAPARFHGTERFVWPEYWIPVVNYFERSYLEDRTGRPLTVLGRLKPGVTPEQAAENLSAVAAQLGREFPKTDNGVPLRLVRPGLYADNGDVIRAALYTVTGLALLVLLAACANLASLFAARAADRSRELALRVALGASRWRLVSQLITESLVVSAIGGAAGMMSAGLLLEGLNRWSLPSSTSQAGYGHLASSVDARVFLVALILTFGSGLLFGMIPAREVWRSNPMQAMKNGPTPASPRHGLARRDLLLGAQIIICTLLVMSSLVAVRGMVRMLQAPLGFQPQGVMLADMDTGEVEGDVPLEKTKAMIDALRRIPGVTAVGTLSKPPFTGGIRGIPIFAPGTTEFTLDHQVLAPYGLTISPGLLETARTKLLRGRDFSWSDTDKTPRVAIVNETFARKMWGDLPAIGQRFIVFEELREVVGVIENGKYQEITESPQPLFYLPLSQNKQANTVFAVRSDRPQNEVAAAIERTLGNLQPNAPVTIQSWVDVSSGAFFSARAAAVALGVMGFLAAMLAVTGIFGMAAYNVSRRMKELGIRVALGARARHVLSAAVGRPILLLGVGSLVGLLASVFASRLLARIVYQANPSEPVIIGGAVITMVLLGCVASALPALRALAVDPSKLLREE
ncbi:MAG: ABC transporter permease [Chthoniobacterales bacterium]